MRKFRTLAIAVAAAFLLAVFAPKPASAISDDTETAIIIVGGIIGGLIVVAIVATLVMRQDKKIFRLDQVPVEKDPLAPKEGLRFATNCPPGVLACW